MPKAGKDGRIFQNPVRELQQYYANPVVYEDVIWKNSTRLEAIKGRMMDLCVENQEGKIKKSHHNK